MLGLWINLTFFSIIIVKIFYDVYGVLGFFFGFGIIKMIDTVERHNEKRGKKRNFHICFNQRNEKGRSNQMWLYWLISIIKDCSKRYPSWLLLSQKSNNPVLNRKITTKVPFLEEIKILSNDDYDTYKKS